MTLTPKHKETTWTTER